MRIIVRNNEVLAVAKDEVSARKMSLSLAHRLHRRGGDPRSVHLMNHAQLCSTEEGRKAWNKFIADI